MHGRSVIPPGAFEIVFLGGCGENYLDVAPREIGVGVARQRRDPRDNRSCGGGATKIMVIAIGILSRQDAVDSAKIARTVV